jgi:uncharacterized flavoprotein (TIGR03862 family)
MVPRRTGFADARRLRTARGGGWAEALGQPVFTGSTGRVFPEVMKASPLAACMAAADRGGAAAGLALGRMGRGGVAFEAGEGAVRSCARSVTVLALGGASWRRLGSDGAWAPLWPGKGVDLAPFRPANMGFAVDWTPHMAPHLGQPLKAVRLIAGDQSVRGEAVISARGIEGGGFTRSRPPCGTARPFAIDLMPDRSVEDIARRLRQRPKKRTVMKHLGAALGLDPVKRALLQEFGRPLPDGPDLARLIKALTRCVTRVPRPMDEAISTAGGVTRAAVDDGLMLRALPGVFVAGEMLDWEAPTGGYLITGCLATGLWAGRHAAVGSGL